MARRKRAKNINRKTAELILLLHQQGLKQNKIGDAMNLHFSTVNRIVKSGSWEGYLDFKKKVAQQYKKRVDHEPEVVEASDTQEVSQERSGFDILQNIAINTGLIAGLLETQNEILNQNNKVLMESINNKRVTEIEKKSFWR